MRRPRQFAFVGLIASAIGVIVLAVAPAAAVDRPLLAHAAGDSLWVAGVVQKPADSLVGPGSPPPAPAFATQVWVRPSQPGKPWRMLAILPGRVTSMASRDAQLAVLMAGGQWMTVFDGGSATGQGLPASGRLVTLADDGHALWAVGTVAGGLAAARADIARQVAATRQSYDDDFPLTTRPSSIVVSTAVTAVEPTTRRAPALVLFRQDAGRWEAVAELPSLIAPTTATEDLSATVVARTPVVAWRSSDGAIRAIRWHDDKWDEVATIHHDGHAGVVAFNLLADTNGPVLWTTTGPADPGTIRPLAAGMTGSMVEADARPLHWDGSPALAGLPAAAIAGGYLRVIGTPVAKPNEPVKPYEQRFEMTGAAVGAPAEVWVPTDLGDTTLMLWVQGLLLASLAFAIGTSVYRQVAPAGALGAGANPADDDNADPTVVPAPLAARAAAGVIDLLPLLGCTLVFLVTNARHPDEPLPAAVVWLLMAGVAVYLAHTTVLEAMTARTAGKWLTGLRVANLDGTRPERWQLVARNLLRVLDPLVWIVLSPLRQRTADVLAGTIVIREAAPKSSQASPPSSSEPSPPSTPTEPGT